MPHMDGEDEFAYLIDDSIFSQNELLQDTWSYGDAYAAAQADAGKVNKPC